MCTYIGLLERGLATLTTHYSVNSSSISPMTSYPMISSTTTPTTDPGKQEVCKDFNISRSVWGLCISNYDWPIYAEAFWFTTKHGTLQALWGLYHIIQAARCTSCSALIHSFQRGTQEITDWRKLTVVQVRQQTAISMRVPFEVVRRISQGWSALPQSTLTMVTGKLPLMIRIHHITAKLVGFQLGAINVDDLVISLRWEWTW